MAVIAQVPSAVRDSININTALKKITTEVNSNTGSVKASAYTVTGDDQTAGTFDIDTGLSSVNGYNVMITRAGIVLASADVSELSGTITIATNGADYVVTTADVVNWIAVGTV